MSNKSILEIQLRTSVTLFEATIVEKACMPPLLSIKIYIHHQFGCTDTTVVPRVLVQAKKYQFLNRTAVV